MTCRAFSSANTSAIFVCTTSTLWQSFADLTACHLLHKV